MPAQRASVVALTYFLSAQVYLTRRGQAQGEPRSVRAAGWGQRQITVMPRPLRLSNCRRPRNAPARNPSDWSPGPAARPGTGSKPIPSSSTASEITVAPTVSVTTIRFACACLSELFTASRAIWYRCSRMGSGSLSAARSMRSRRTASLSTKKRSGRAAAAAAADAAKRIRPAARTPSVSTSVPVHWSASVA